MKKILIKLTAPATLALAFTLTNCNNAEEVKKQTEEQITKIQTMANEKLNGLQDQVNAECMAMVDSLAKVKYTEWMATEGKKKAKPAAKPKAKPTAKKEEPKKPETVGSGKPKMGDTGPSGTIGNGKPKMGNTGSSGTIGNGKPKMGGGN